MSVLESLCFSSEKVGLGAAGDGGNPRLHTNKSEQRYSVKVVLSGCPLRTDGEGERTCA